MMHNMAKDKIETVTDISTTSTDQTWTPVSGTDVDTTKRGMDVFSYAGLAIPKWDKVVQTQASTTDTWTFELATVTVSVVVITYTDSTKEVINDVERTS